LSTIKQKGNGEPRESAGTSQQLLGQDYSLVDQCHWDETWTHTGTARQDMSESRSRSSYLGLEDRIAAAVDSKRSTATTTPAKARADTMTRLDHIQTELSARTSLARVNRLPCLHYGTTRITVTKTQSTSPASFVLPSKYPIDSCRHCAGPTMEENVATIKDLCWYYCPDIRQQGAHHHITCVLVAFVIDSSRACT
jgi:hypothetical protein